MEMYLDLWKEKNRIIRFAISLLRKSAFSELIMVVSCLLCENPCLFLTPTLKNQWSQLGPS